MAIVGQGEFNLKQTGDKTTSIWSCCAGGSPNWRDAEHFSTVDGCFRN